MLQWDSKVAVFRLYFVLQQQITGQVCYTEAQTTGMF